MHLRRIACLAFVLATAALAFGAATASSGRASQQALTSAASTGTLNVTYKIRKFVRQGTRLFAYGTTTGRYVATSGASATQRRAFKAPARFVRVGRQLAAAPSTEICPILDLTLDQLDLDLLGLVVHLDKVHLTLKGDPQGGLLGSLLCSLAKGGKLSPQTKNLNWVVTKSGLPKSGIGFSVGVGASAAGSGGAGAAETALSPATICPVLELTLGPLDADLLGLLVHLDTVHLVITADSDKGLLGSALCSVLGTG